MIEHEHPAEGAPKGKHSHQDHHAHMAADFRQRLWISLVLTLPILVLSPLLQSLVGLSGAIQFPGDLYVLFGFSSAVFWYGGWPFLKGLITELKSLKPGMMKLVAVAITTAYLREQNIDLTDQRIEPHQAQGQTVVFVLVDGQLKGAIEASHPQSPAPTRRAIDTLNG
jgi:cation transport ATPase